MPDNFRWSPIEDLPSDLSALSDGELHPLLAVWEDQRTALASEDEVAEFTRRLSREWAIETGIIERVYTLDRGTTGALIERGIDAALIPHDPANRNPVELAAILQDHVDALEGLFAFVKGERELSVGYIKEVHSILLRHQDTYFVTDQFGNTFEKELSKGVYKTLPNSPTRADGSIHEYCPPEHVASEMDRMVELHHEHLRLQVPPEVESAWLHHAFSQIHPFSDGNGRVARLLASLLFVKAGGFPALITRDDPPRYIDALEQADRGNLSTLVSLLVHAQRRDVLRALQALPGVKIDVPREVSGSVDFEVAAARRLLVLREGSGVFPRDWDATGGLGSNISAIASTRIMQVCNILQNEIGRFNEGFKFTLGPADGPLIDWVREGARQLGYEPTFQALHRHTILSLVTHEHARIVFSVHGMGPIYRGVAASLLLFVLPGQTPVSASESFFQCNYKDSETWETRVKRRFETWHEHALAQALSLWRQRLQL